MVHVHAREPDGTPTVAVEHYRAVTRAILEETRDIIVNFSTGWVGLPMAERVAHISELRPEIGALNIDVVSEMAANVWKVVVRLGDIVAAGDPLVIQESMKMGIPVEAPPDGTVAEIRVQAGAVVQEGDVVFAVVE